MLGLLLATLLQAEGIAPAPAPSVITNPDWAGLPSAEVFANLYPKAAIQQNLSGNATIQCMVSAAGALQGCFVVTESPKGVGFGEAALRAAASFKMRPMTKDGAPVEGGTVRIPMRFVLPGETVDPMTGFGLCYGITAAAAEKDPANIAAMNAYGFYAAQLAFRSAQARVTPDLFEAHLSSARGMALKGIRDRSVDVSLDKCIGFIPKPPAPKP